MRRCVASGPTAVLRPGASVRHAAVGGLVGLLLLTGCGDRRLSRAQLERRYVDEIVDAGIARSVAECVIDRLFSDMSDDELREFNTTGTELTPEQAERVGELAGACGS
ncbi:MAG: hypothetical protein AB7Q42_17825 [Acidimicrobiia bacterium]